MKRIFLLATGGFALAYLFLGSSAASYASTLIGNVRTKVQETIPVEVEIDRAEELLRAIEPEIQRATRELAEAEVELDELDQETRVLERRVAAQTVRLATLAADVRDGTIPVSLSEAGVSVGLHNEGRAAAELSREFEGLKDDRRLLDQKRGLRERRCSMVRAASDRLEAFVSERERLCAKIESLRVQHLHVEALAATGPVSELDDGALGEAKALIARIGKRLDVDERVLEGPLAASPAAPLSIDAVVASISSYLGKDAATR